MKGQSIKIKETFSGRSSLDPARNKLEGRNRSFKHFALSDDKMYVRRFKLKFRDGRRMSIPYAFLPIVELSPQGVLTIRTDDLLVKITGRGLDALEDWLSVERVLWMSESASGMDDETVQVFIASIEVETD